MEGMKMNRLFFTTILVASAITANAQTNVETDSLTMETMMHNLPEVMVKGSRPIVKAERGMLSYNMPLLMKQLPADNAYEALTRIPGISDATGKISFSGNEVTLIVNGQATTLTQEQLAERLKAMPAAQLAKAEVMLSAPLAIMCVEWLSISSQKNMPAPISCLDKSLAAWSKTNTPKGLAMCIFPCKEASSGWMRNTNWLTAIRMVNLHA